MSVFLRVLVGILVMVVGFFMVAKTNKALEWLGRVDWAEEKLGSSGSYTFWKLVGILTVFLGIFIATNIISDILTDAASIFAPS